MSNTRARLYELLRHQAQDEDLAIEDRDDLKDDLGIDSLDVLTIGTTLEREFGIEISDEAYEKIVTVGDFVNLLESLVPLPAVAASG